MIFLQVIGCLSKIISFHSWVRSEVLHSAERPTGKHHWMPVNWQVTQDGYEARWLWSQWSLIPPSWNHVEWTYVSMDKNHEAVRKVNDFHHHSTANINCLPFLQRPAPSQAISLCERFGSKQRPLEPKQMNALKAPRPIRDARRDVDGTGLMGLGWLGPPKFIGFFCLIHKLHWIFGCFFIKPRLVELFTKIQSIQYWWNMWTKSDLVGGKERGKPCVQFFTIIDGIHHGEPRRHSPSGEICWPEI